MGDGAAGVNQTQFRPRAVGCYDDRVWIARSQNASPPIAPSSSASGPSCGVQARARTPAEEAARRIAAAIDVHYVYLFGSLARGAFQRGSDIDLAVDGLPPGKLIDALTAAEQGCPFRIDVIPLDAARSDIAQTIRSEGVLLWPRAPRPAGGFEQSWRAS